MKIVIGAQFIIWKESATLVLSCTQGAQKTNFQSSFGREVVAVSSMIRLALHFLQPFVKLSLFIVATIAVTILLIIISFV